ncbi:DinQ-like type I toxin DqlB, partial [Escherichia coli]
ANALIAVLELIRQFID